MPDLDRPRGFTDPEVTVEVIVATDGTAALSECNYEPEICDAIAAALEGARFRPARVDDEVVAARIRARLRVRDPAPPAPTASEQAPPSEQRPAQLPPSPYAQVDEEEEGLGVTAIVDRSVTPEEGRRLSFERAREIPGTFGDPFRAALLTPGVTPFLSLLPFFYLRGAPITGTVYYYDDIPLPAIYHVAAGPAVIHPRLVGPIEVVPGIARARYGRHSGGVVIGAGPPHAPPNDIEGELELRLLDVNGYIAAPLAGGSISGAGRFGYPGLIARAVDPNVQVDYGDYAIRLDLPTVGDERVQFVWIGSYDQIDLRETGIRLSDAIELASTMTFHRGELRYLLRREQTEVGLAMRVGYDASELPGVVSMEATHFGSRFWAQWREGDFHLRVGGDAIGTIGQLRQENVLITDRPPFVYYAEARTRSAFSVYSELWGWLLRDLSISVGVRADLWGSGPYFEGAIDPRLRARWQVTNFLDLHAAVGVARMPAVFLLPLPGLSELPLRDGLQTAVQSEVGGHLHGRTELGESSVAARVFVHHYDGLMFTDLRQALDPEPMSVCTLVGDFCRTVASEFRAEGLAYGLELDIRSDLGRHFWTLLTYTLSKVEVSALGVDVPFVPSYDVRHVINGVLQWDSGAGFTAGLRLFVRSGEPDGFVWAPGPDLTLRYYVQRMAWHGRVDLSAAYHWDAGWARLRVGLEWMNVLFFLEEGLSIDCDSELSPPDMPCPVTTQPGLFLPSIGIRGEL